MRRVAVIGCIVLSIFMLVSCAGSKTPQGGSTSEDASQAVIANSGSESDSNTPSTSDEIGVDTPDPASVAPPPEIELNRAELLASSEVDITYAQEYARNRALASFKKLFPDLVIVISREGEIGNDFLWEEALPSVNEMIEADPDNPEFHLLSGFINFQLNYNEDAIAAFEKTIELDPRNFEAHFHLGVIYLGTDELPKSINYLTQSIELATNPSQVSDAFARRALSYCVQEHYDKCFADIKNALYLDPYNGFTLLIHGMIFKDKAVRDSELTGKEGIPGIDLGVEP